MGTTDYLIADNAILKDQVEKLTQEVARLKELVRKTYFDDLYICSHNEFCMKVIQGSMCTCEFEELKARASELTGVTGEIE